MERLTFRLYSNKLPEIDDDVYALVENINELNSKVTLLEYNHIDGMMPLSELSKKKVRSIRKVMKKNQTHVLKVTDVDEEKNVVYLSKKRVTNDEIDLFKEKMSKEKHVLTIMNKISHKCNVSLEKLYETFCWKLHDDFGDKYIGLEQIYK